MSAFAQRFSYDRTASGSEHKTKCRNAHHKRQDQVDCRKRGFADIIGYKQPIHHAVDGREDHHHDRRKYKRQ